MPASNSDSISLKEKTNGLNYYWVKSTLPKELKSADGIIYQLFPGNTIRKRSFSGPADIRWWGTKGDGKTNDAAAINSAIGITAILKLPLHIKKTANFYLINPQIIEGDESTSMRKEVKVGLKMLSNMNIVSDGATLKMADNISSRSKPVPLRMFFSNDFLENITISGLVIDMNGKNNLISPGNNSYNNMTQAHICFSGTKGNIAAGANNVLIENCQFINGPGASCIIAAQSNKQNVNIGENWMIRNNRFYNNGFDCNDHSSVYAWVNKVSCYGNTFDNPAMFEQTGGLVGYEIHGSNQHFYSNTIKNYYQGLWVGVNWSQSKIVGTRIYDNKFEVSCVFVDFFNGNLNSLPYPINIEDVVIEKNVGKITNDPVNDHLKQFVRISSVISPNNVYIRNNTVRSESLIKPTTFLSLIVLPDQKKMLDEIYVTDNSAEGISTGVLVYFNKSIPQNKIIVTGNKFGTYRKVAGADNADLNIYGAENGIINEIRTDLKNIKMDKSNRIKKLQRN